MVIGEICVHRGERYMSCPDRIIDMSKKQTPGLLCNQSERCLTCRYYQKISHRQAEDLSILDGQDGDLDSTELVKQTVSQLLSSEENPGS